MIAMIARLVLGLALSLPLAALALDPDQFHLFGFSARGDAFDITPSAGNEIPQGDPEKSEGIGGTFYTWKSLGGDDFKSTPIGTCRVRNFDTYSFSCRPGAGAFAGTEYVGEKVTVDSLRQIPDAEKLYEAWVVKNVYGEPAAYYRCRRGCTASVPQTLLFIWYGD